MTRGFSNVGIPPKLAREIRKFLADDEFGYQTLAEFVREAARTWLVKLRRITGREAPTKRRRGPPHA